MSDQNGIRQSPFGQAACPTPGESEGFGGSNFDLGTGANGIIQSPFDKAVVPAGSGAASGGFGPGPSLVQVADSPAPGTSLTGDISVRSRTIDKR
jgi:hypothetical protein